MKKVFTVLGARPQFIKASVVSTAIAGTAGLQEVVAHTGQHFDANMSDIFFNELGIRRPDYHLDINGGGHGQMTGKMMIALEEAMQKESPDIVMVYGDTNSTLAGALVAAKLHIPIAHVEAGLRSFNMKMPEEVNRRLTDHVSALLFCPNEAGILNLSREGICGQHVRNTGDVMYDAALHFYDIAREKSGILADLDLGQKEYVLATVHRQENTDDIRRFSNILSALSECGREVIFPVHPRTRKKMLDQKLSMGDKVRIIDPLGYLDMVMLERNAAMIVTDSGGVQKEAYFHRVPCITLRDETEWTELVDLGWNRLVSPSSGELSSALRIQPEAGQTEPMPYGDGHASEKIAAMIEDFVQ